MTTISNEAIGLMKGNKVAKLKMALHFKKHQLTIDNWLEKKDAMLTTPDAVRIISEETGLSEDQILVRDEENTLLTNSSIINH